MNENFYDKYSNKEWLGNIPSDWKLKRVGNFFRERSDKVDDKSFPPLSVTKSGIIDQLKEVAKTNDRDNRKLVRENDFVINSRSDRKGSSGISPRDGSVSLINIVLEPHDIEPKFIEYLFKSFYFKEEFFRNGKGIHMDLWSTRWEQFKNINIPIPSKDEQIKIIKYLDEKNKKIKVLIEKIDKKIALLKEQKNVLINQYVTKGLNHNIHIKDSQVKWIGKIPKHWTVSKLKYVSKIFGRIGYRGYTVEDIVEEGNGCITLGPGNIVNNLLNLESQTFLSWEKYYESPEIQIFNNDIIFVKTGSSIGKSCFIKGSNLKMTLNPQIVVLKNLKIHPEYLYYLSICPFFQSFFKTESAGGSTPSISQEKIKEFKILIPPREEQIQIVEKINDFLGNNLMLEKKYIEKINLLKEYNQSLTSEVVTGKIRITEDIL